MKSKTNRNRIIRILLIMWGGALLFFALFRHINSILPFSQTTGILITIGFGCFLGGLLATANSVSENKENSITEE